MAADGSTTEEEMRSFARSPITFKDDLRTRAVAPCF
jgi:hypothetical protein